MSLTFSSIQPKELVQLISFNLDSSSYNRIWMTSWILWNRCTVCQGYRVTTGKCLQHLLLYFKDLLSGRLPPVEEEIVAVEDSMAARTSEQHAQRRSDFQLSDHSPYCASTCSNSVATASTVVAASTPQTLLNYLQMDQSSPSYISPQFTNANRTLNNQQQSQPMQQYPQPQEQLQLQTHPNELHFNQAKASSSSSEV